MLSYLLCFGVWALACFLWVRVLSVWIICWFVCDRPQARLCGRFFLLPFDWESERREGLGKRFHHLIHALQRGVHRYLMWLHCVCSLTFVQLNEAPASCECFPPTGPKLYKEPSAKSNKHIIQNALAHCCLAGKVNEGQKNKILDVSLLLMCLHLVSSDFILH